MTFDEIFSVASESARDFASANNLSAVEENFLFEFTFTVTAAADSKITVDAAYMWQVFLKLQGTLKKPLSLLAVEYCTARIETFPNFVAELRKLTAADEISAVGIVQ